jgi:hypothetical protein
MVRIAPALLVPARVLARLDHPSIRTMEDDMTTSGLVRRQWESDGTYHQDRTNLAVHLVAVPAFMLGTVLALVGIAFVRSGGWRAKPGNVGV